ncbi:MAG: methyltransferase domain-containing protein [Acidobacteriota bacterium]|jgi:SAM-dependent methyltransferase
METTFPAAAVVDVDSDEVRAAIRAEYGEVATSPEKGFHFHTGRKLAAIIGYRDEWLAGIPERAIESFAGTGSPFSIRELDPGERVVDIGSGAGVDSLIAGKMVGSDGEVVGIDMTPEMLARARAARDEAGMEQVRFVDGYMEELPVEDGWADVVISNGVFNLTPNKPRVLREMFRVLRPGGRLQIADIMVEKEVSAAAKQKIDLWTG